MITGPEITLVKPRLDLADDMKEALVESYTDHIKYLLWPEPDPSIESDGKWVLYRSFSIIGR